MGDPVAQIPSLTLSSIGACTSRGARREMRWDEKTNSNLPVSVLVHMANKALFHFHFTQHWRCVLWWGVLRVFNSTRRLQCPLERYQSGNQFQKQQLCLCSCCNHSKVTTVRFSCLAEGTDGAELIMEPLVQSIQVILPLFPKRVFGDPQIVYVDRLGVTKDQDGKRCLNYKRTIISFWESHQIVNVVKKASRRVQKQTLAVGQVHPAVFTPY